jgi:cell division topological specificity factor
VNDRIGIAPLFLEKLKEEMTVAVSKYVEIDGPAISLGVSNSETSVSLVASIPVRRIRRAGEAPRGAN